MLPPSPGALQPEDGRPVMAAGGQPGVKGKPGGGEGSALLWASSRPPLLPAPSGHLRLRLPHSPGCRGSQQPCFPGTPPQTSKVKVTQCFPAPVLSVLFFIVL